MGCYSRKLKKGIRWFYSGQYLNLKYHSKCIYLTKSEAAKAERQKKNELDEFQRTKPHLDIPLRQMIEDRLDYIKTKSDLYYKETKKYLSMLLDTVGNKPIEDITTVEVNQIIAAYADYLKAGRKTNHKVNAMIRIYRAAFNYAYLLYEVDKKNPCTGLKLYSVEKLFKFIPTDEQIKDVKNLCDREERLLIDFALETGGRIGEILRFKREDVRNGSIYLYTRKSRNSDLVGRKMPMPECIKTLEWQGRLFKRWNAYPRFLERKVRKLNQPFWGFHNLRHRFASKLSKEGRPLFEIMSLLGHSSLETTQIYLQLLGE